MLKLFFSVISLFLLTNQVFALDQELHKKCLYPTIFISRADDKVTGSGVVVKSEKTNTENYKNVFISCAHLIKEDGYDDFLVRQCLYKDWSTLSDVKSYPAYFYGFNRELDLSVGVFWSKEELPTAKLDFEPDLFIGSEVFRIGYGLGDEPRLDYGKITWKKKEFFRTSIFTVPGDSGSPVFFNNAVVGIMVKVRMYKNNYIFNISYASPLRGFKDWSKDLGFIWENKSVPQMPFYCLKFKDYHINKN